MNQEVNEHWSGYYDKGTDFGLITSQMLTKMLSFVDDSLEKKCLDIGSGTGQLTRELNHRGWRCVGIDAAESAVRIAQSLTVRSDELEYLHFDIERDDIATLPLQPYTLITCKLVYAFIQNKPEFLRNVGQLLAQNGRFVIITPIYEDEQQRRPIAVKYPDVKREIEELFTIEAEYDGVNDLKYFICKLRGSKSIML